MKSKSSTAISTKSGDDGIVGVKRKRQQDACFTDSPAKRIQNDETFEPLSQTFSEANQTFDGIGSSEDETVSLATMVKSTNSIDDAVSDTTEKSETRTTRNRTRTNANNPEQPVLKTVRQNNSNVTSPSESNDDSQRGAYIQPSTNCISRSSRKSTVETRKGDELPVRSSRRLSLAAVQSTTSSSGTEELTSKVSAAS